MIHGRLKNQQKRITWTQGHKYKIKWGKAAGHKQYENRLNNRDR